MFAAPLSALSGDDLLAQTRAARDSGDLVGAERLARQGMQRSEDPVWPLTLSLILADQARTSEALAVLERPWPGGLPQLDRRMAEGHAHARAGNDFAALRAYGEALRLAPDTAEARSAMAAILDRNRGPHGAEALDGLSPRRAADQAAALTRWGAEVRPDAIARRFEGTDRALAAQDTLLASLLVDPAADPALVRRIRLDRMVALRDRVRMAEVVAEAQVLAPLPAYADQANADARLYMRQPAEALAAYERVLAADPANIQARYGRVFSLVELERLNEAAAAAEVILASEPRFRATGPGPATTPNMEHAYAAVLAGEVRLWGNRLADGHGRIRPLAEGAPANAAFRRSNAAALAARGWPRAAEDEAAIAASLDPDSLATGLSLADAALGRNRLQLAQAQSRELLSLAPENRAVQRLDREVRAQMGWLIDLRFEPNFSSGGGTFAQGEGYSFAGRAESPLLGANLRALALFDSASAEPPEGRVERHRAGAGLALQTPDVEARLYGAGSWGSLPQASAGAELAWRPTDKLTLSAAGEVNSIETPMRALLADISGDSLRMSVGYRRDERFETSLQASWLGFSDGNDRLAVGASAQQQLVAVPHFTLRGRADFYASWNSNPGGPYFAPSSDLSLSAGLSAELVAWRRYEKMFTQAGSIDLGVYDQAGFAANWIGVVRYEHRWRHDPFTEVVYGLAIDRRVYDGEAERNIAFTLGLRQRL